MKKKARLYGESQDNVSIGQLVVFFVVAADVSLWPGEPILIWQLARQQNPQLLLLLLAWVNDHSGSSSALAWLSTFIFYRRPFGYYYYAARPGLLSCRCLPAGSGICLLLPPSTCDILSVFSFPIKPSTESMEYVLPDRTSRHLQSLKSSYWRFCMAKNLDEFLQKNDPSDSELDTHSHLPFCIGNLIERYTVRTDYDITLIGFIKLLTKFSGSLKKLYTQKKPANSNNAWKLCASLC